MNFKKGLLQTLTVGLILTGIFSANTNSYAAETKVLKLTSPTYRNSGYAYKAGIGSGREQSMWKIYEYTGTGTGATMVNSNNGIYCLKLGPGFGSATDENGNTFESKTYTKIDDMKNPTSSSINTYKSSLPATNNYNSIVWILDQSKQNRNY